MRFFYFLLLVFSFLIFMACREKRAGAPIVLIYTQHLSDPDETAAIRAVQHLGQINGFVVSATDTCNMFRDDSLSAYAAIFCLNRCGTELGKKERVAMERFMEAGGGFVGVHPTAKTGDWKWYADMIGSDGDSGVSYMHQKYDGGRVTYICDSLGVKSAKDQAALKNVLNAVEYAIGHFEPLNYSLATAH
jgi:hypothetical protein